MSIRHMLCLLVALTLPMGACKKKPKKVGDKQKVAKKADTQPPAAIKPNEGRIKWPIADLRSAPSKDVIAKLKKGVRITVLETKSGWTKIRAVGGKSEGWVPSDAVEGGIPLAAAAAAPAPEETKPAAPADTDADGARTMRVKSRRARIRSKAWGKILGLLKRGTKLEVLKDDGKWLKVKGGGKVGWMARTVLEPLQPASGQGNPTATKETPSGSAEAMVVRWPMVNLREAPSRRVIGKVRKGTRLTVLSKRRGWLKVQTPEGKTGFVAVRALKPEGGSSSPALAAAPAAKTEANARREDRPSAPATRTGGAQGRVVWGKVNLRTKPWGPIAAKLVRGQRVRVLASRDKWLKVRTPAKTGWVTKKAIRISRVSGAAPTANAPTAKKSGPVRQVVWSTVNLRESPKGKVIFKLARGTRLRELDRDSKWFKVTTLGGERDSELVGWVVGRSIGVR